MATGTLSPDARLQFFDNNGVPLVGGKLYTYLAGTTTPATTYSDVGLTVANPNPIVLNASGRPSVSNVEVGVFLTAGASYKYVLQTSTGASVWTQDNVSAVPGSSGNQDITGTAGEALTAGQVVYLLSGQWFKADSAAATTSTAPIVGMVPASIALGASGTIRLAGQMAGLTSLTIGSVYYLGTAGALTATPPTLARIMGTADSTSTLVMNANPGTPNADNGVDDFRLTLTTGVPVTNTDVTAATTIYCTPSGYGNRIALYDSAGISAVYTSAQFSIAVPATTNTNYDVFTYSNLGVPTLELNAWRNSGQAITGATNATPIVITANAHTLSNGDEVYVVGVGGNTAANGTWTVANITANTFELATSVGNGAYTAATGFLNARASTGKLVLTTTGTYTKTADLTRRYLGMVRTTGVSGQTEDSFAKRYLWNYYNRVPRIMRVTEATDSWNYTPNTFRQANAAAANQLDFVVGVADKPVSVTVIGFFANATAGGINSYVSIGMDSTTTPAVGVMGFPNMTTASAAGVLVAVRAEYLAVPTVGHHTLVWLEKSNAGGGTTVWYGDNGDATTTNAGIVGLIEG